ncbi:uroporphyrinogen decarboxylase family protein [Anaeromassilibacillus sp. An200]|uniref:uroporphyrinogen decarboxylase family protein n=1 Tax=Anaeromassilibacillus sp. An200 TaxID=1965587 RepID=UPI000B393293|nr:uroporphyrinogen decarboxylase family protein [Anaeromassilibacillus sp. An200]OUP13630.1 hypothetical protein B5F35_03120 [Anaeromassilibacillus sp. An200]
MDKRTRVLNAFEGKPVDRPPVGFWFHFPAEECEGQACVDAHLNYYNRIDVDFAKIMCDHYFEYPIPKEIQAPEDWSRLQPLDRDHPFIQEQVERARRVRAGVKENICMFYNVFAPFSSIRFGTSDEFVMRSLKENPEAVQHALNAIAQMNALLSQLLVEEGGMDGIYYCVQGGEHDRFTPEEYRSLITPSDLYVLEHANRFSKHNILHCCGWAGIKNNLEVWKDYPAAVFNWAVYIEGMDLKEGREYFGKPVLGGFDNRPTGLLFTGSREEIVRFTKELVQNTGSQGMMIGADCTLPATIDKQRIQWVVDAVNELTEK